jgi:hypothetical protein
MCEKYKFAFLNGGLGPHRKACTWAPPLLAILVSLEDRAENKRARCAASTPPHPYRSPPLYLKLFYYPFPHHHPLIPQSASPKAHPVPTAPHPESQPIILVPSTLQSEHIIPAAEKTITPLIQVAARAPSATRGRGWGRGITIEKQRPFVPTLLASSGRRSLTTKNIETRLLHAGQYHCEGNPRPHRRVPR